MTTPRTTYFFIHLLRALSEDAGSGTPQFCKFGFQFITFPGRGSSQMSGERLLSAVVQVLTYECNRFVSSRRISSCLVIIISKFTRAWENVGH